MSVKPALVKICGIMEERTLAGMSGLPISYIGFVFAKSRRQLTPEQAGSLHRYSRGIRMADGKPPLTVGVFVNPTLDFLAEVLAVVPLDVIQLHGDETPADCLQVKERFGIEVWRALPVAEAGDGDGDGDDGVAGVKRLSAYEGTVSAILLDTAGGGTGRAFRWDLIPLYRREAERLGMKLFVAGGLTPDNAEHLIADYRPDGADISSGVETDGVKDIDKITAFAERVSRS